jgi:hypothetical protein
MGSAGTGGEEDVTSQSVRYSRLPAITSIVRVESVLASDQGVDKLQQKDDHRQVTKAMLSRSPRSPCQPRPASLSLEKASSPHLPTHTVRPAP